ncbi:hypothetical protein CYMTET_8442 [Cymbomonas tetramitiformis]|uniref:Uncharacterized protein n=1 Tax=Cymbomonas tetramitiformis TaxID=36881 RepID=A0AAE0LG25_9CHLO|nr:hypothetical protein CYMTET_8442 [Cymbomonas tetramitiformis]
MKVVFKTVQSYMRELEGMVVRPYCDNQARYIQPVAEANEWADRLSRCEDINIWRLNRHCLAHDWRGENNWVNPLWGLLDEVAKKIREKNVAATVAAPYWLGQSWVRELEQLAGEVVILPHRRNASVSSRLGGSELIGTSRRCGDIGPPAGTEENKIKKLSFLEQAFRLRWRTELGISEHGELAVQMQEAALQPSTKGNCEPKVKKFILYCQQQQREWLPAPTVLPYLASLLESGRMQATFLQPYLSAINGYCEELGYEAPAKGRSVTPAVKGMAVLQANRGVVSEDVLSVVLLKEKSRHHHQHTARGKVQPPEHMLWARCWRESAFFGGLAQTSSAMHRYIDSTAIPDEYMKHFLSNYEDSDIKCEDNSKSDDSSDEQRSGSNANNESGNRGWGETRSASRAAGAVRGQMAAGGAAAGGAATMAGKGRGGQPGAAASTGVGAGVCEEAPVGPVSIWPDRYGGAAILGRRVRIFWPDVHERFEGVVRAWEPGSNEHLVLYDDGEEHSHLLGSEHVEWLDGRPRQGLEGGGGTTPVGSPLVAQVEVAPTREGGPSRARDLGYPRAPVETAEEGSDLDLDAESSGADGGLLWDDHGSLLGIDSVLGGGSPGSARRTGPEAEQGEQQEGGRERGREHGHSDEIACVGEPAPVGPVGGLAVEPEMVEQMIDPGPGGVAVVECPPASARSHDGCYRPLTRA